MKARNVLVVGSMSLVLASAISLSAQTQKSTAPNPSTDTKLQPLNVKPGLWERTVNYKMAGAPPIPAGMLDKLTPEQRARFTERMKASMDANTRTSTDKNCITKEELQDPVHFNDKQCVWTILESTSTRAKGQVSCEQEGLRMDGSGDFEATDAEHIRGSMHMNSSGGGKNMTVDGTFAYKWLGSSCGNMK
jgi:hypothetical protein